MVTSSEFSYLLRLLCLFVLHNLSPPAGWSINIALTYRDKVRLAKAALGRFRPLIHSSLFKCNEFSARYQYICENALEFVLPSGILNMFQRSSPSTCPYTMNKAFSPCVTLYIDVQGIPECPLEVTILVTTGSIVHAVFHECSLLSAVELFYVGEPSGIMDKPIGMLLCTSLREEVRRLFSTLPTVDIIWTFNPLVVYLFFREFLQITLRYDILRDPGYPDWSMRSTQPSHHVVRLAHNCYLPPPPLQKSCAFHTFPTSCDSENYSSDPGELARICSGAVCTLSNVMEIFYFKTEIGRRNI